MSDKKAITNLRQSQRNGVAEAIAIQGAIDDSQIRKFPIQQVLESTIVHHLRGLDRTRGIGGIVATAFLMACHEGVIIPFHAVASVVSPLDRSWHT